MTWFLRTIAASVILFGCDADALAGGTSDPFPPGRPDKLIARFTHRTWLREQGLPQNSVNAIIQVRNGYLWIGTQEGIARFDGNQFTVFDRRNTPQLRSNYIWSLMEDRTGAVWAGTNGGGVARITDSSVTTFTTEDGLPGNTVWCTFEDTAGTVWIGTDHGLAFTSAGPRSGDSLSFRSVPGLKGVSVRTISQAADGALWLGSPQGIFSWVRGGLRQFMFSRANPIHVIRQVRMGRASRLFFGVGAFIYEIVRGSPKPLMRVPGPSQMLIFDIHADTSGALWVATGGGGLCRFARGSWSTFTTADGLPDDQVRSLCIDREGTIWAGTYGGGLNALHVAKFTSYTRRTGLANEFILSLSQGRDGSMWLGTYGGGLSRLRGAEVRNYPFSPARIPPIITSVLEDRNGRVYLGSPDVPLLRFDPTNGRIQPVTADSAISIGCLFEDRSGRIWMGSLSGAAVLSKNSVTLYSSSNSPIRGSVIAIAETPDSSVWFGTHGAGLVRLYRGTFTQFTANDGVNSDVITALYVEQDGTLWIGTDGGGLVRLHDGRFTAYTSSQGLFDDVVFTILEDDAGFLWMSSNNGIFRAHKDDFAQFTAGTLRAIPCQSFGTADGMKSSECNGRRQPSAWKDRGGRLWFATLKGAVVVDPSALRANQSPPLVIIEQIRADESAFRPKDGLEFSPGVQRLTFEYTALSFVAPERTMFRFRLDGYDVDWVDAGPQRQADYTSLSPGEYLFRVIARNNEGVWNETGASVSFRLRPFFYQSPLFIAGCISILLLLAFAGGRLRVRQLQRREIELVNIVTERTERLSEEKKRVENALRDAEDARKEAERQRELAEEANTLKSRLLRLAAHDMKSPLVSIKGFVQIMRQQTDRNSAMGEMADMINGLTANLVALVNQLLNSEAIESGRLTLVFAPVDADRLARDVVASNTMFAASKRQTIEFTGTGQGTCVVEADEARLRDAFDNLVTNAVKYSPPGKPIRVSVARTETAVRFSVRDEGPGFTEEDKKKLFVKFQRLSAQPTGGESSTGLGLAITREIIDLHHGTISVESMEGQGSTFTIELPLLS